MNAATSITPPGRYPQGTFQPISHPGVIQGASLPPPTRRSRLPVVILAMLVVVLASLVFALVVTPLGHMLFGGSNTNSGNNQPGTTTNNGITPGVTTGNKGSNITPVNNTQGMPATSTSCPAAGLHDRLFPHHSFWVRIQQLSTLSMKAIQCSYFRHYQKLRYQYRQ